ncbi:MAG: hypothetical protein QXN55_09185 [Candidatus Nitrosotenuis sp.]
MIRHCLIEEAKDVYKESLGHPNYKDIDFHSLRSSSYHTEEGFINYNGLTFNDYVGCQYLTGNELLYYPELAKKIREIKDYPILKRSYAVDCKITGKLFFEYFLRYAIDCYQLFQTDLIEASKEVNNLIHLYGEERHTPIIDAILIESGSEGYYHRKKLLINGVVWELDGRSDLKITEYINFYSLLNIPAADVRYVQLEDAVLGTPFIAVRIRKSWKHKGHVQWYNLDTLKQVSKTDIPKWKL